MRADNHLRKTAMVDFDLASDDQPLFDSFRDFGGRLGHHAATGGCCAMNYLDRLMGHRTLSSLISSLLRYLTQANAIASSFGTQPHLTGHVDL